MWHTPVSAGSGDFSALGFTDFKAGFSNTDGLLSVSGFDGTLSVLGFLGLDEPPMGGKMKAPGGGRDIRLASLVSIAASTSSSTPDDESLCDGG